MDHIGHVFLIDDDKALNVIHTKILGIAGYKGDITVFFKPEEALSEIGKLVASPAPAEEQRLIFLDIQMPGLDGWAFLDELDKLAMPAIKVYMLGAVVTPVEVARAEQHARVSGIIQKPLTVNRLKMVFGAMESKEFLLAN